MSALPFFGTEADNAAPMRWFDTDSMDDDEIEVVVNVEEEHPWLWLAYALGIVAMCAASALWPMGVLRG